jgi:predicted dehydrogenase
VAGPPPHIPALRALPNYQIRALSAHNPESAGAVGEVFGVGVVFSDHEQLVTRPDIDVVAITVKVSHHRELVFAALAAGKAVGSSPEPAGRTSPPNLLPRRR